MTPPSQPPAGPLDDAERVDAAELDRRFAAARTRFTEGTVDGLRPETPDHDAEPVEDPAADTLGWADR